MAESFFDYPAVGNYTSNRYFQKKLADDKMLITTDHGAWIVLTQEEYGLLRKGKAEENPDLFNNLIRTGVLVSKDNIQDISQCFYRRNCQLTNGVNLHILTPTLRCNHSCIYCHAKSVPLDTQGHDMDEDTARKIVDFIFQSPAKKITIEFQGGEPLANFPIVEYVI
ncbi:MAG: 4Fe-4S cluster-binding domain-containing protein, partial [Candidatus Aenigmarchaeota archaeon]|nr:4Fe-4S cluster-binding domain-containing protein [Candidatus Aenigmarchaeota archaeon]